MQSIPEKMQAGLDHHRAGRLVQAEQLYRHVLSLHPRHAGAVHLLGLIAFQVGKLDVAERYLLEAIGIDAFHAPYRSDLGEVFRSQGKITEAIATYRESLRLNPDVPDSHTYLGTLLLTAGDVEGAVTSFRAALKAGPQYVPAHLALGEAYLSQGDLPQALRCFETAVQIDPQRADSYLWLGKCQRAQGKLLEAIACFQKALRLDERSATAHFELAQARLSQEDYTEGWREYEWRTALRPAPRHFDLPWWDGRDIRGQRLLLHAEDDLADALQFSRFVPLLVKNGVAVSTIVGPALEGLLESSGFTDLLSGDSDPPPCVAQARLGSLPLVFGTRAETIPVRIPYLAANESRAAAWRDILGGKPDLKVGLIWQGDPRRPLDRLRSLSLATLAPLAQVPGVQLFSFQRQEGRDQISELAGNWRLVDLAEHFDDTYGALADTAALMKNLDLVVTCDAPSAHLAGALGVRTWVALSTAADWRWLRDRDDSPWYPTLRLFRQATPGDWNSVAAAMSQELAALVAVERK